METLTQRRETKRPDLVDFLIALGAGGMAVAAIASVVAWATNPHIAIPVARSVGAALGY